MYKRLITISSVIAGALVWAPMANAATVDVYLQEAGTNGGASMSQGASAISDVSYGTFDQITVGGSYAGPPGISFDSTTLSTSATSSGTLTVDVTATGITGPLSAALPLLAELQSNGLPVGWTVTESIYLNGTLVSGLTNAFSATGTVFDSANVNASSGPYSLTEEFVIAASSTGQTTDNIELSATPLPSTWTMLIASLLGLGLFAHRGSKKRSQGVSMLGAATA